MSEGFQSPGTVCVHGPDAPRRIEGAVVMPIFQSATYEYGGQHDYHDIRYVRLNNSPNHEMLHRKLAALEHAEAALVTASGMAAISTALLSVLSAGDHLLIIDGPYGGTRTFVTDELPHFGIEHSFIAGDDPADWAAKIRPDTKAIYIESITNPLMQVPDIAAAVRFAKERGLVSMIDNTFTSPINFRPAEHGIDLSLHSATKYLNGHSDLACGAVIGRADLVEKATKLLNHLGGTLDPHACFLLDRGLKTLELRVRRQNETALRIARMLRDHPNVQRVCYPGLEDSAGHKYAAELFDGFGGMIGFEVAGGVDEAERVMRRMHIPVVAVSLGGVESLVIRPAVTAYANVSADARRALGISDALIRLSVGVEDTDELLADVQQALEATTPAAVPQQIGAST